MTSLKRSATIAVTLALLAGAALYAWQREQVAAHAGFASVGELRAAYAKVAPGMEVSRLAALGFDRARPGGETLSYLAAMEFFVPANSRDFDALDPAILSCLGAADRCGAYVFRLGGAPAPFGFAVHAAVPEGARVVFLVKSGRVAYKRMEGE